jgi:cell division protein FtsQ
MDGRGRLAQSLKWLAQWRSRPLPYPRRQAGEGREGGRARAPLLIAGPVSPAAAIEDFGVDPRPRHPRWRRAIERTFAAIIRFRLPPGVGTAAASAVLMASLTYGMVKGEHVAEVTAALKDARDGLANAAGFRVVALALTGAQHVSREEILAVAGVSGKSSLLFFDVEAARARLKTNPWIADATILKLLPGELQIAIKERAPFALWQKDRHVSVIAEDGTVLEPYVSPALLHLPLVVGKGAETRAKDFLALLDRHPDIRARVRAAVLVGERRWNLRLKNGLDVRLPETEIASALERLAKLDRENQLVSRDIVAIDLRLHDRVTVRLSDGVAQARIEAWKKTATKKGGKA